jgi:hypothetical protein
LGSQGLLLEATKWSTATFNINLDDNSTVLDISTTGMTETKLQTNNYYMVTMMISGLQNWLTSPKLVKFKKIDKNSAVD